MWQGGWSLMNLEVPSNQAILFCRLPNVAKIINAFKRDLEVIEKW